MSGSIDSQKENDLESSIHPLHSSTPSKKDDDEESPSRNVTSTYNSSFESTSTKKSSKRQVSGLDLSSTPDETQSSSIKCLSPWEKWLCNKEKEKRKHLQQLNEKRRQKEIDDCIKEERKLEKKLLADAAHEKWLKQVEEDQKRKIKIEKEKAEQENKIRKEKEQLIKELAPQKYNDWKNKKDKLMEEKQKKEEEKMKAELEKLEEKKQLNEEAFKNWLREVSIRPKCQTSVGYGYVGGVLISYHDGTSLPRPSYCNPNPWNSCTDNEND